LAAQKLNFTKSQGSGGRESKALSTTAAKTLLLLYMQHTTELHTKIPEQN
jgi:hypothetical protein